MAILKRLGNQYKNGTVTHFCKAIMTILVKGISKTVIPPYKLYICNDYNESGWNYIAPFLPGFISTYSFGIGGQLVVVIWLGYMVNTQENWLIEIQHSIINMGSAQLPF